MVTALTFAAWSLTTSVLVWSTWLTLKRYRAAATQLKAPLGFFPVSILKPLKGADPGLEQNLRSFFEIDYPEFELLFSVADGDDDAVPVVQKLISEFPKRQALLVIGDTDLGPNPKINNLVGTYGQARHDWILVSDSNIRVQPSYLKRMVAHVGPGVGLVTAVVAGRAAKGIGGHLEAMVLNTYYTRGLNLGAGVGKPAAIGKSMLFRRSDAKRFGGLGALANFLAEDYMAGELIRKLGFQVVIMNDPVEQYIGAQTFEAFWQRHLRWGRIRKSQLPLAFFGEGLTLLPTTTLFAAISLPPLFGISIATAIMGQVGISFLCDVLVVRGSKQPLEFHFPLIWLLREILALPLWLHIASGSTVNWRGNALKLQPGGTLAMKPRVKPTFLWGAATSSHQIEGDNKHNDWWHWETKGNIDGGISSGKATDHWNRFSEDLDLAASLGMNTYRFSVEWSRIEPRQGEWDQSAIDWYKNLINECEKRNLLPMLTLHHFTSPQWFAELGGFNSPEATSLFLKYTRKVVEAVGSKVPLWCTLNEPMVLVGGGYLGSFMPPARFNPKGASLASATLLDCHAQAYDLIHREITSRSGPWKREPIAVGIAHNMLDFMPARSWHPLERIISRYLFQFYNRDWLDAITGKHPNFGIPFLIPRSRRVPSSFGRRTVDFIGVNYYTKAYVQWRPKQTLVPAVVDSPIGIHFAQPHETKSDLDWAIHPHGFRKLLKCAAGYGLPLYVTENGIADRNDQHRKEYLLTHLEAVSEVIATGADIRGYYYWSLIDNFEWVKGFDPQFGLIHINYETFKRTVRPSGTFFKEIIAAHQETDGTLSAPQRAKLAMLRRP